MAASSDKDAATLLKCLPSEGATVAALATAAGMPLNEVQQAVQRLVALKLVTDDGQTIRITPFAEKARAVFEIV